MTDLRQGVTPTQHAVLDKIEANAMDWPGDFNRRLAMGRGYAADATRMNRLADKRSAAILAAALLIDAAEEITRLIGEPG